MKRIIVFIAIMLSLSLTLASCGRQDDGTVQSAPLPQSSSAADASQSAQAAPAEPVQTNPADPVQADPTPDQSAEQEPEQTQEIPAAYREILDLNAAIVKNGDAALLDEAYGEDRVSIVIRYSVGRPESWGYCLMDVDGDGEQELLLAALDDDHIGTEIGQMFRIVDGQAVEILTGMERNWYQLREDGMIYSEGSGGAAYHNATVYALEPGCAELAFAEEVYSDLDDDNNQIWFHADASGNETLISEEEAFDWMASQSASVCAMEYIPFSEYQAS